MNHNKVTVIGQNVYLSNSIDKLRQLPPSSSKGSRLNPTNIAMQYPEKSVTDKLERLKSRRNSIENIGRLDAKYDSKGNDTKKRKLKSDKNPCNHITDNSIDKIGRSTVVTRSAKSNYQNLKASKLLLPEHLPLPNILPELPSHTDEYNYEVNIF